MTLIDTSIWSLAFRKKMLSDAEQRLVSRLSEVVRDLSHVIIGPIRQEVLSGISDERTYEDLRQKLAIFPDHEIRTPDYELAAKFHNICRKRGIQGSHIDFLICAVASNNGFKIFTFDEDFKRYQKWVEIQLEVL